MNHKEDICAPMPSYNTLTCSIEELSQKLHPEVFIKEEFGDSAGAVCLLERNFAGGDDESCPLSLVATSLGKKKNRKRKTETGKDKVQKRKIDAENRKFKESWTRNYFFIHDREKIVCLICNGCVAVPKVFNLKRHYMSKHKAYEDYKGDERVKKIRALVQGYYLQHNACCESKPQMDDVTEVSYELTYLTAKSLRPFSEGDFIKKCLIISAKKLCHKDVVKKFEIVDLSPDTMQGHVYNLSNDVTRQLRFKSGKYVFFALAVNVLTVSEATSYLLVLLRGVTPNFTIEEECVGIDALEGYSNGSELLYRVLEQCNSIGLDLSKLSGVATNGCHALIDPSSGMVPLLVAHLGQRKHNLITFDSIMDYRLLFSGELQFDYVMKVVVSVIKYIKLNGLNRPTFRTFIEGVEGAYSGVEFYTDTWWWVNKGSVLKSFVDLLDEFIQFFMEDGGLYPDLKHPEWVCDLAFLVDITNHLNTFDLRLRGKDQLVPQLLMHVTAFQQKLELFYGQLQRGELHHFPTYQIMFEKFGQNFITENYAAKVGKLKEIFHNRFYNLLLEKGNLQLFRDPFSVSPDQVVPEAQLELIDLQSSVLRSMHVQETLLNFYKYLSADQYPYLIEKAALYSSLFSSTYTCEQTFDIVRRVLRQEGKANLQAIVRLATTNLKPNIKTAYDTQSKYGGLSAEFFS